MSGYLTRAVLLARIRNKALKFGGITLSSGAHSDYIIDLKHLMLHAPTARAFASRISDLIDPETEWVGTMATGGIPLVNAITHMTQKSGLYWADNGFYVRKEAKAHGTGQRIEGLPSGGKGFGDDKAVVVDDVSSSGTSLVETILAAREAGASIKQAVVVVDREEGAREALQAHDVSLYYLFTATEVLGSSSTNGEAQ